jgi:inositol transporter-like SP family MFS transporter
MLVYALGICLVLFGTSFPFLLSGYIIIGLSVGADITASWTIIAENAPKKNRARHCGVAQVAWAAGAVVVLLLSVLLGDIGLLGNKIVFGHLLVIALITYVLLKKAAGIRCLAGSIRIGSSRQEAEGVLSRFASA